MGSKLQIRTWLSGVFSLLSLASLSCTSDESTSRYSSGLEGSAIVADLDPAALQQICDTFNVHVETHVNLEAVAYIACLPSAIFLSQTTTQCEQNLDTCQRVFPETIDVEAIFRSEEACFKHLDSCRASVDALEGCVDFHLDTALYILNGWSCDFVDDPALWRLAGQQREAQRLGVRVCTDVSESCDQFAAIRPE